MKNKNKNNFIHSNNNKRYHAYDYYLNKKYNSKVAKIALNAGFACPHIVKDGRGCIYCGEKNHSGYTNLLSPGEIVGQFNAKKEVLSKKWKNTKYIAYFQAGSNTFASLDDLKKVYESVLNIENLVGIDIATRPDCIDEQIAAYLSELNQKTDVTVELGLQTCHDITAEIINRGYTLDVFEKAYKILSAYKIPVTLHIINSLPGETAEMMLETVKYIAKLDPLPLGVKIHMLYVEENTELYKLYISGELKLLSKEEYISTVVSQLEFLPPQVVIMRLTGDPELDFDSGETIPSWVRKKFTVINDIDKLMEKRGTEQGKLSGYKYYKYIEERKDIKESKGSKNHMDSENGYITYRNRTSLTNILSMAKRLFDISIKENGVYADFTMGKGNDTLYIKKACPSGKIYAFDIQQKALEITRKRLESENCFDENVVLICDSHDNFNLYIKEELDGAVFNLGYLPGGDKTVTTRTESTLKCLSGALDIIGRLSLDDVTHQSEFAFLFNHSYETRRQIDLFVLAENLNKSNQPRPRIYIWCGTEDFLYEDNVKFRNYLETTNLEFRYEEAPGDHSWGYWDEKIQTVLKFIYEK